MILTSTTFAFSFIQLKCSEPLLGSEPIYFRLDDTQHYNFKSLQLWSDKGILHTRIGDSGAWSNTTITQAATADGAGKLIESTPTLPGGPSCESYENCPDNRVDPATGQPILGCAAPPPSPTAGCPHSNTTTPSDLPGNSTFPTPSEPIAGNSTFPTTSDLPGNITFPTPSEPIGGNTLPGNSTFPTPFDDYKSSGFTIQIASVALGIIAFQ